MLYGTEVDFKKNTPGIELGTLVYVGELPPLPTNGKLTHGRFPGQDRHQQQPGGRTGRGHEELHLLGEAPKPEAGAAHRVLHLRAEHGRSKLSSFPVCLKSLS